MYLYEIAKGAAEVLLSAYLRGVMVLAGLALATGAAGRVPVRIEDLVNGAPAVRQTDNTEASA